MFQRLIFMGMIATLFVVLPSMANAPQSKTSKYWRLEQKSWYFGNLTIYASSKAIKIASEHNEWMHVAKAPNWDVYIVGPEAKSYFRFEIKKFRGHPLTTMVTRIGKDTKATKTREQKRIAGLLATKYLAHGDNAARGEVSSSTFWVTQDLKLPPQVIHVLCCDAGVPELDGVPLRVNAIRQSENPQVMLDTYSVSQVNLPDEFFVVPPDYKLAKTPEGIMMSRNMKDMIEVFSGAK